MTSTPLEITIIYSASGKRTKRAKVSAPRSGPSSRWLLPIGMLSVLIAGAMAYASWWEIDKKVIYMTLMTHTPIEMDMSQLGQMFGLPNPPAPTVVPPVSASRWDIKTTQAIMGASAYGWLTFSTIAYCALALSGGAAIGKSRGTLFRRLALVLLLLCIGGLGWGVYTVLTEYGQQYPPKLLRAGMCALALIAMLLGLSRRRNVKRWSRLAAFAIIVSSAMSVLALYLGHECAAIDAELATPKYLATVFAIQSIYGWLLWPISSRF